MAILLLLRFQRKRIETLDKESEITNTVIISTGAREADNMKITNERHRDIKVLSVRNSF